MRDTARTALGLFVFTLSIGLLFAATKPAVGGSSKKSGAVGVKTGSKAPDFELKGADGKTYKLASLIEQKKWVVLEWTNRGCPFVKKHYKSGNMQKLQADAVKKGAMWFSVISSAEGKQGYCTPSQAQQEVVAQKAKPTAVLLDPSGKVGRLYDAKTTPHMFVIDPKGLVAYQGAIDNISSADASDVPKAKNYVRAVLNAGMAGKKIPVDTTTTAYGCSVKYKN